MLYILRPSVISILDQYKSHYKNSNNSDIREYSYKEAKKNKMITNIEIISDYIDKGDFIEYDFLQEKLNTPIRIRQIANILLERYLKNNLEV